MMFRNSIFQLQGDLISTIPNNLLNSPQVYHTYDSEVFFIFLNFPRNHKLIETEEKRGSIFEI